jgi:hypothetical protein
MVEKRERSGVEEDFVIVGVCNPRIKPELVH